MNSTTIFIIGGAVLLVIFVLIAKLAIRWAIRLTIVGVILVALLGAVGFWWWSNRLVPRPRPRQSSAPARRASAR
jgi:protein-S-isoprenylcysteine O-methyltransferase Ste14